VPVGVGVGREASLEAGVFVGVEVGAGANVGVDRGDCEVAAGAAGRIGVAVKAVAVRSGVLMGFEGSIGVEVGVQVSVLIPSAARVLVTVRVGLRAWVDAGTVRLGLMLPQTYDDIEQHEQIRQPMKKRIACSVRQEMGRPPPIGSTICSALSWRRSAANPLLRLLIRTCSVPAHLLLPDRLSGTRLALK
jgi:hypothetical protein